MRGTRPYVEWVQTRPRNETLDCLKYALAALRLSGIDLKARAAKKQLDAAQLPHKSRPATHPAFPKPNIGW
jgi:phage terminase large subunit GpA-like protein